VPHSWGRQWLSAFCCARYAMYTCGSVNSRMAVRLTRYRCENWINRRRPSRCAGCVLLSGRNNNNDNIAYGIRRLSAYRLAHVPRDRLQDRNLRDYAVSAAGSKSPNASNTNYSHLPIPSSDNHPTHLHTFITSSLFNLFAALALRLLLSLLGHQHHPL